jgi:UDP-N-acetylglucosamine 1-carboxyvinyltransferase
MVNTVQVNCSTLKDGVFSTTGFKHLLVGIVASSICLPETTIVIKNVSNILETRILARIINEMNGFANFENNQLTINTKNIKLIEINEDLSKQIHGAIYLLPTLLGRFGKAKLGKVGGCELGEKTLIGNRPIGHMVEVLKKFGCEFTFDNDKLIALSDKIHATAIDIMEFSDSKEILTGPLVSGATKTAILMALSANDGLTTIKNPYLKPDVTELLEFLINAGCDLTYNQNEIQIINHKTLKPKIIEFNLISDICQIMTYITCALYFDINIKINNIEVSKITKGMNEEFKLLNQIGVNLVYTDNSIFVPKSQTIKSFHLKVTSLGIYSDNQPFFALIATKAKERSIIEEYVWKNRFLFANELIKIGHNFKIENNRLTIYPSNGYKSSDLYATDLRAAAVLLIAALMNKEKTIIHGLDHLQRGYENLIKELQLIGAEIHY